jgi:glutathione S-transferase
LALTIYGSPRSRTMRVLWLAAELDLPFEHVPHAFDDPALKSAEFVRLNPAGAIPTIVDDDFALSESLAINLYLAKKHQQAGASNLYTASAQEEANIWRWSLWAQGHLEPWIQKDALLADLIRAIGDLGNAMIYRSLAVLDRALESDEWLVGSRFTVADLNVAGVLSPSRSRSLDLTRCPRVWEWLIRCYARPAAVAVRQRFQSN